MKIFEFKLKGKKKQYARVDDAIRTSQFVRNKCLRYWMDNKDKKVDTERSRSACRVRGVNKYALNKYCAVLAAEFPFADELNSMASPNGDAALTSICC